MRPARSTCMLLLLAICAVIAPPAAAQSSCSVPADACAFADRFLSAFSRRDWDAFRVTLDDSITVILDSPAPPRRFDGRAEVEEIFRRVFPSPGAPPQPLPPPLRPVHLRAQDFGDVVVVSFELEGAGRVARRTLVLRRGPAGWRVVHIHGSSQPG